jgi:hypothetical protein
MAESRFVNSAVASAVLGSVAGVAVAGAGAAVVVALFSGDAAGAAVATGGVADADGVAPLAAGV